MSYQLIPYSVRLLKLQQVVASGDHDVTEAARSLAQNEIFAAPAGDSDFPLFKAVAELIAGDVTRPDRGDQYGYALQVICEHLGDRLPVHKWKGVRWNTLEDAGLNAILGTGPPIELPPILDFPTIGHLTITRIRREVELPARNILKIESAEVQELLDEYAGWVRHAYDDQNDLVLFYY